MAITANMICYSVKCSHCGFGCTSVDGDVMRCEKTELTTPTYVLDRLRENAMDNYNGGRDYNETIHMQVNEHTHPTSHICEVHFWVRGYVD